MQINNMNNSKKDQQYKTDISNEKPKSLCWKYD